MTVSDLLINTFFVVLGAAISAGLAIWVEVSDVVERIRARSNRHARRSEPTRLQPEQPTELSADPTEIPPAGEMRKSPHPLREVLIDCFEVLSFFLQLIWELRYFLLVALVLVSGPWWLGDFLEDLGASNQVAVAALVGNIVAAFGFFAWVLTDTRPPTSIGRRIQRALTLTVTLLICVVVGQLMFHSPLLSGGMCMIFAWGAERSWA